MNFRTGLMVMGWAPPCGPAVSLDLQFNSQDPGGSQLPFGGKWSFSYLSWITVTAGVDARVRDGDGRIEIFPTPSGDYPKTYQSSAGDFRTLVESSAGSFTLTHPDGTAYHYGKPAAMQSAPAEPLLLDITDIHGNSLTITHNSSGEITTVTHSALTGQQSWSFTWTDVELESGTCRRITQIADPFPRFASFTYDPAGNLSTVTDMGGRHYGFEYVAKPAESVAVVSGSGSPSVAQELFISTITTPKGTTTVQTEPADGDESAFDTIWPAENAAMGRNHRITITDPELNKEEYFYSACTRQTWHRDATQLAEAVVDSEDLKGWSGPFTAYSETLVGERGQTTAATLLDAEASLPLFTADAHDAATGKATEVTDAAGQKTWRVYYQSPDAAAGKLQCLRLPKSNNDEDTDYEIRYAYTNGGKDLLSVKRNLDGQEKTLAAYTYYTDRRPHTVTDATGRVLTFTWKTNGLPESVNDSLTEDTVSFTYDSNWYPSAVLVNEEIVLNTSYDTQGRLHSVMDAAGLLSSYEYDSLDRIYREFTGDVDEMNGSFTYRVWQCCFVSETTSGKRTGGADAVLDRTLYQHDGRGLLTRSTDTAGHVTQFGHDAAGHMTSLTDPNGNTTCWEYDGFGRFMQKTYPDDTFESVTWNPANPTLPDYVTNRRGDSAWYGFDEHGLPTRTWGANENPEDAQDFNITRTWDTWDRLETIKDTVYAAGVHHFDYDLTGRITELNGPWDDDTITWTYDDANRKVTRESPGSITVETTRDEYGRLDSLVDPLGSYEMDYAGLSDLLISVTHSGGFSSAFEYFGDDLGHALKNILSKKGTQEVARHDYTYDSLGRIATWKRSAPLTNPGTTHEYEWTMTHDFADQLTGVVEKALSGALRGGWTYGYDAAGNRYSAMHSGAEGSTATATSATHNNMNQITALGGGGLTRVAGTLDEPGRVSVGFAGTGEHPARMLPGNRFETELNLPAGTSTLAVEAADASGNRSSYRYSVATDPQDAREVTHDEDGNLTDDGVRTYDWDSLSRLEKVTWTPIDPNNQSQIRPTTEFKYNALGQRAERIETDGSTVVHYFYLYDGISLVERRTGTDPDDATIDRRYFTNGEQRWDGTAWQTYHYCRDHLGSVREVLGSGGTLVARYDYTPYGERITRHEASGYTPCDLGFTGHITLPSPVAGQTELVLAHFRGYDPALGRWLSSDPIGERGGMNLYQYAGGDPTSFTDRLGLSPLAGLPAADAYSTSHCSSSNVSSGEAVRFMVSAVVAEAIGAVVVVLAPEGAAVVGRAVMRNPAAAARAAAAMDETGCAGAGLAAGAAVAPVVAKTVLKKNDIILAVVHDGKILAQTSDFMLSHAELVKRFIKGGLPSGATVCTIGKEGNRLVALTSKTFHDKQTHVSEEVYITIKKFFE
jgi:RHS repeat-associated protein